MTCIPRGEQHGDRRRIKVSLHPALFNSLAELAHKNRITMGEQIRDLVVKQMAVVE